MTSMFTRNDGPHSEKGPEPATPPAKPSAVESATAAESPKRQLASAQPLVAQKGISLISRALKITGQLESSEDIHIEGEVEGDVRAAAVRVGSGARVHGTVTGEEVELSGSVEGKIEARKVVLTSTAHMTGDVVHQDISIQSGAYINGNLKPEYAKTETNVQSLKMKTE
jgi:cytoskeletal protein CcmA (bactofilin family)